MESCTERSGRVKKESHLVVQRLPRRRHLARAPLEPANRLNPLHHHHPFTPAHHSHPPIIPKVLPVNPLQRHPPARHILAVRRAQVDAALGLEDEAARHVARRVQLEPDVRVRAGADPVRPVVLEGRAAVGQGLDEEGRRGGPGGGGREGVGGLLWWWWWWFGEKMVAGEAGWALFWETRTY